MTDPTDVIERAQAWLAAADERGINRTDRDGYLAVIEDLVAEVEALQSQLKLIVGRTALRCIEIAKWPQGLYDEQAYYGSMFAEFIEKEFSAAIDAAMKEKP